MEFLNTLISKVGRGNVVIIGCALLALIIFIVGYRYLRVKKYRKLLVEYENRMNAIKTMPLQYRLGRVQGIAKNLPEVQEQYEEYEKEYTRISNMQSNDIVSLINDLDEKMFYRKLRGSKKQFSELNEILDQYENDSKILLDKIEVITEIENEQRIEIIRIKEMYRKVYDSFTAVRFKIEDFVPAIPQSFEEIDRHFVELEDYMNTQKFDEASQHAKKINSEVEFLRDTIRDLPAYISIVRNYVPKNLQTIEVQIESMNERGFALENLNITMRVSKIKQDLENTIMMIQDLNLENVGSSIEVMTDEINSIKSDFEKEEVAYKEYHDKRDECYKQIGDMDNHFKRVILSTNESKLIYIMDDYNVTIDEDYEKFKDVLNELADITQVIQSKDFAYSRMIERFSQVMEMSASFEETLTRHDELNSNLRIQEKRALDELDNINIVLLEIKSEIKNKHLPMINESYKDYIEDSYNKADAILAMTKKRPIDLKNLSSQVDAARDVIYKLYDNVHNLIVTAEMVEDAIIYGNRYRTTFLEVNTELTKAELLFRNGEYTKALSTCVDIIEKVRPGSYEMLINSNKTKSQ